MSALRGAALIGSVALLVSGCSSSSVERPASEPVAELSPAPPVGPSAEPGPSHLEGIRPAGFERTREGAVAAATAYLALLHQLGGLAADGREEALRSMAATGAESVVREALDALAVLDARRAGAEEAHPGARVLLRDVPVAYDAGAFSPDRASVSIWSVGIVVIEGVTEATEVWSTNTVELVWENGDWRVWSWARRGGPTPAASTVVPTDAREVLDSVATWKGYRYVPAP